ncbi:MAG: LysR family transcriptional regulator [Bacteroidales bacterium]|nr:LysR family transcriptional regulator [Clostridium sp.]MCM1204418.1 LysR family transcriptional regulator [Bacteroidales bacterium]
MTLLAYQIFQTVVEQGSFQHAAEVLNLTPSAISHAISTAEKELGFPLFNRNKNGVTLTSYGENLQPYILTVLNSDAKLQQAILEFNGLTHGSVKIGTFSSVCNSFIPNLVTGFSKLHPNIEIKIYQGTYDDVYNWLKTGVVDLGFLSESSCRDISIVPLYKDELLCVVPKHFQTRHRSYIELKELADQNFVSQRESTDADIQNLFRKYQLQIRSSCHVVDDLSTIAMVAAGLGICIMPKLVMQNIPYHVDMYPLKPAEHRTIGLCSLNPELMAPAVKSMYKYILKFFKTLPLP